jgi:predicted AlkP superfamily phosphohydrolase/phosphomutase
MLFPVRRKVAMIGVDAAELSFVQQHLDNLPNFARLLTSDAGCEISSTVDYLPGSIWPSFFTSQTAGDHGFYQMRAWDADAMSLRRVTPELLPFEPFWRRWACEGVRVVAIDVPMTFAPKAGNSVEVVGWGSHQGLSSFRTSPLDLSARVRAKFGTIPLGPEIPFDEAGSARAAQARETIAHQTIQASIRKAELTTWLARNYAWDLLITIFGEAHRAGHTLWPSDQAIPAHLLLSVYKSIDRALGVLIERLSAAGTTVLVFALHGMGPNNSQCHLASEILKRINLHWLQRFDNSRLRSSAGETLRPSAISRIHTRLPAGAKANIARFIPTRAKDYLLSRAFTSGRNWSATPALLVKSDGNGYIRLNLRGREREGMLEAQSPAFNSYLSALTTGFRSFQSQYGEPLVDKIVWRNAVTRGARSDLLPDLIITWREQPGHVAKALSEIHGEILAKPAYWRTGNHRSRGFLFASSPNLTLKLPRSLEVTELAGLTQSLLSGE